MGKKASKWLMSNIEQVIFGVNLKQFFTFRGGDMAYTFQRGSDTYGQYLAMTELNVGGRRRIVIILEGKEKGGWRSFGLEFRKMFEPNLYALGVVDKPLALKLLRGATITLFCSIDYREREEHRKREAKTSVNLSQATVSDKEGKEPCNMAKNNLGGWGEGKKISVAVKKRFLLKFLL